MKFSKEEVVKEGLGIYLNVVVCNKCSWFDSPKSRYNYPVCPDCGEPTFTRTGQYRFKEVKHTLLGFIPMGTSTKITGFELKEKKK